MKRMVHVIGGLDTGGAEMMLLKLLSAPQSDWCHVVICLQDQGTIGPRIAELGVPVHCLGIKNSAPNPLRALSLVALARRLRPHLIHGWMYYGNILACVAAAVAQERLPVLWNIQMSLYDLAAERFRTATFVRLGVPFSRYPASIIYNSRVSAEQHEAFGYSSAKRIVIPTGYDCEQFRPDPAARKSIRAEVGLDDGAILIGLVARYHPMKDHAGFLRAAGLVAKTHPDVYFVLAGRGVSDDEPALARAIQEYQLQNRIFLLGERADNQRLTASLDIACSASGWGEGCSNTVGEAMASGVPCVVTDVGDSAHLVGATGLSVPPGKPEAFAQALVHLIEGGAAYRQQLGAAARRRIESEFSMASVAGLYDEVYERYCPSARSLVHLY